MKKLLMITGFLSLMVSINSCKKTDLDKSAGASNPSASNAKNQNTEDLLLAEYLHKNVAIFDARIKSIDSKRYVKEIYLIDYSLNKERNLPNTFTIGNGTKLMDDGNGFDLVEGDGIYTSAASFHHNEKVPFNENAHIRSVLEKPIVHSGFQHVKNLVVTEQNYQIRITPGANNWQEGDNVAGLISITFNDVWCGCTVYHKCGCSWDSIDVTFGF